ncbi:MAG: LCP family protein [Lachnospiraceae bacterium]|nr:LCP family protein [Lachnospiraceae bacterium]
MATKQEIARKRAIAKRRAQKKRRKIILFILEIVVLAVLVIVLYGVFKAGKIQKISIDDEDIVINSEVASNEALKGYKNIALFGVDSRDKSLGKGNRTDTIMICSINEDTGDVKLCSVFRDTYLNLGNDSYNKCNAAYAKGGPEQAINMLNMNLDLNITDYVTVGFTGLTKAIDELGGVTIDVREEEISHLNNYQISMVGTTTDKEHYTATEGKDYTAVTHAGPQTLNGLQATAYCRIRYVGNDFERALRQRTVLQRLFDVAKTMSPSQLNSVLDETLPYVSTSLDASELADMISKIGKYNIVADDGFPFEENRATGKVGSKGSCVIPDDLKENVIELQKFLFDNDEYVPSSEVETCSQKISADTGY